MRENERQLLKLKNSLEIEIQNLKVENERLSFSCSKKKETKHTKKTSDFYEELKVHDDSFEVAKPVRDYSSFVQSSTGQKKGIEKLNELDELIKNFKQRKLTTNKD